MAEAVACRGRTCDAEVVWARHYDTGKRMPFDAEPLDPREVGTRGLFWLDEGHQDGTPRAYPANMVPDAIDLYRSHFATCSDAARFRGKGRA
jgi:hypothetical protein